MVKSSIVGRLYIGRVAFAAGLLILFTVIIGCSEAEDGTGQDAPSSSEQQEEAYPDRGRSYTSKGWTSNDAYLDEVTKEALQEMVENHLKYSEDTYEYYSSLDESAEDYNEEILRKHELRVQQLTPLLDRIKATDASDMDALNLEYNEMLEILGKEPR